MRMLCSTMCMGPVFALAFVITSTVLSPCSGQLTEIDNGCTCPGDVLTYECTVIGAGFTIWQGTAFHCPDEESRIELRHSSYSSGTEKSCNDGAIVARSDSTDTGENIYVSRLTVNLMSGSDLNGTTVECIYRRSSDGVERTVGSNTVRVTGAPPPPTGVILLTAHPQELVFEWTPIESNCSSLEYGILSDCGTCANKSVTTQTTETCSIVQSLNTAKVCSFTVSTIVCESVYGMASAPVYVTLKVPQAPVSNVIPIYNETGNKLMELEIKFTKVGSFLISNGIDGSAVNYTIKFSYIHVNTDVACETVILSESALSSNICIGRNCTIQHSSPCFLTNGMGLTKIEISATNVLGTGPATIFTLDAINSYVNIKFKSENIINCVFVDPQDKSILTCDVYYGPCQQTPNLKAEGILVSLDTVTIELPTNIHSGSTSTIHCYTISASNGTFTVLVRGISGKIKVGLPIKNTVLTLGVFLFANSIAILVVVIFIGFRIMRRDEPKIPQCVTAHIIFDLIDETKKLLEALEPLEEKKISITNIIIGHGTDKKKVKIYIECDTKNLSEDQEQIIRTNMSKFDSLEVHRTPVLKQVPYNTTNGMPKDIINCTFPEKAVDTPGLLRSVLKLVYKIRECEEIIVSDVIITPTKKGKRSIVIKSTNLALEEQA